MDDAGGGARATTTTTTDRWRPWAVRPQAGFEVYGEVHDGLVPLRQVDDAEFAVGARFRFRNPVVEERVVQHLGKVGAFTTEAARRDAFRRAADYGPQDGTTDLASIPRFMRWLVNTYGAHTLAAIIHDKLITETPNGGELRSDVVSDRFLREMLHACGMTFFLRWIVWTAVALRTRWAADGLRRAELVLWGVASVLGMGGSLWFAVTGHLLVAVAYGAALLLVAAGLWGRQWGAAVVAAVALPWIAPTGLVVVVAIGVLWLLERVVRRFDPPL